MREEERVRQRKGKERSLIYLIKKRRKYTHKFSIEMRERSQDREISKNVKKIPCLTLLKEIWELDGSE